MNNPQKIDPTQYKLQEGGYSIIVKLYECSDLRSIKESGSVDSMVEVKFDRESCWSGLVNDTINPIFGQTFIFKRDHLTVSQLEDSCIEFNVYDVNRLVKYGKKLFTQKFPEFDSDLIGHHELDLSSVYFQPNHRFKTTHFALSDKSTDKRGCQGFVMATVQVLGQNDEPTPDVSPTSSPNHQITIPGPKVKQSGHQILAEIYKAEHLLPLTPSLLPSLLTLSTPEHEQINAKVVIRYAGQSVSTKTFQGSANPTFNEILFLQAMMPNHSKNISIELYDVPDRSEGLVLRDEFLVGSSLMPLNRFKWL